MRRHSVSTLLFAGVAISGLALVGCSSGSGSPSNAGSGAGSPASSNGLVQVVASTNVYGNIVKQIGGDFVDVTSIISDPSQDPHSYEADAQVQLSLSKANIVIENGGGYDDFVDTLLNGANNSDVTLLNAVDISGYNQKPAKGAFNEHVWYDFPTVEKVADKIVQTLSTADADNAATFKANGSKFTDKVQSLIDREAKLKSTNAGTGIAITEPVPLYMLDAIGLVNDTPPEFSEAIEEGTDVSPAVLQETLALFTDKTVKLLAYNEQTAAPETKKLLDTAKANDVAVVPVSETLPDGDDYLSWMTANLDAIDAALSGS